MFPAGVGPLDVQDSYSIVPPYGRKEKQNLWADSVSGAFKKSRHFLSLQWWSKMQASQLMLGQEWGKPRIMHLNPHAHRHLFGRTQSCTYWTSCSWPLLCFSVAWGYLCHLSQLLHSQFHLLADFHPALMWQDSLLAGAYLCAQSLCGSKRLSWSRLFRLCSNTFTSNKFHFHLRKECFV